MRTAIVVDASALVFALVDDGPVGRAARGLTSEHLVAAPELIDLEVGAALRRQLINGRLDQALALAALDDLVEAPVDRYSHTPLLRRCWELRDNVTFYDAAYVALAEALDAPLVTADERLAGAAGPRCDFELLS